MIIECELIGGYYDGQIHIDDTEKELSKSVVLMRLAKTLEGEDVMECSFYKRDVKENTKFYLTGKTLVWI